MMNIVFAKIRMKHGEPKEEDYKELEDAVEKAMDLAKELGLSYTPSLHLIHKHAAPLFQKLEGFGELLEDLVEQSHQTMHRLRQQLAGLGSCSKRALALSRCEKMAAHPKVKKAMEIVLEETKRKYKTEPEAKRK